MQYLQNAIRRHHSHNTKHTRTRAHIMNTWTKVTCAPGVQVKREWDEYNIYIYTWTERCDGRTLKEQMETTCLHEHKTLWQCLLFKKWSSKTHDMPRLSRRSKTEGLSGTPFFSRPFRAFLRPFRAFSRPFRAKLLDNFWSYQATPGAKYQYHACQSRSNARSYSVFPTEFIVQLCHAAMPQADEFSPWVFSTDSPMHQIASSTCTSFHGL